MPSTASTTAGLDDMAQRRLGDKRVMMDLCIVLITPEDGLTEDGGNRFLVCACCACQVSAGPVCVPGSPLGGLMSPLGSR